MIHIFSDPDYRNICICILKYLSIYDLKSLSLSNQSISSHLEHLYKIHENKNVIYRLYNKRFFDKNFGKLYIFSSNHMSPSSSISTSKSFWKSYFPMIDEGDIIYLESCNKFVAIQNNISDTFTVAHEFTDKKSYPLNFWQKIGKHYPYRLWINAKMSNCSLTYWKSEVQKGNIRNIKFLESDGSSQNQSLNSTLYIDVKIIYKDEMIYVYI